MKKADVNFYTAKAVVRYDPSQVSAEDMIRAVQKAGFKCTVAPPS